MSRDKKKFRLLVAPPAASGHAPMANKSRPTPQKRHSSVTTLKAVIIIVVLGVAVFFSGLSGSFIGDDQGQIVDNIPVHSITNIYQFFVGSTFYSAQGQLTGIFYRPIMTTTFSLIYAIFGPNPTAFHSTQLLLYILGAIVLFFVLRYFFKPGLALALALIFLVHPINSQNVFYIAAMQEPLFFLFGISAIWSMLHFQSKKSLILTSVLLLLSLLSKESGVLFVAIALLGAILYDRKRLVFPILPLIAAVMTIYFLLRVHAIGLIRSVHGVAPITDLDFWGRLSTTPSVMLFYITKLFLPLKMARRYDWVYPNPSVGHFLIPLILDVAAIAFVIYIARLLYKKHREWHFKAYIFFTCWLFLGLLLHSQVLVSLEVTASETWFYFPMIGLLGMTGVMIDAFSRKSGRTWLTVTAILIIGTLGARTAIRGFDWHNSVTLAYADIDASQEAFSAENILAIDLAKEGYLADAKAHAERSVKLYPNYNGYNTLGQILSSQGDCSGAKSAFAYVLKRRDYYLTYENMAALSIRCDDPDTKQLISSGLNKFPHDATLWLYLAILEYKNGDATSARNAASRAYTYSKTNEVASILDKITNNLPLTITYPGPLTITYPAP